jgi:DNA-binding transcriptional LysR family regulator
MLASMQEGPGWEGVRTFLALYRARTFTSAASALGMHGSTASRRLDQLEEELGVRLFERTPDGLVPTDAAERVLAVAEEAESSVLAFGRELERWEREPEGEVRVALLESMATHIVAPGVGALLRQHPRLRLVLVPGAAVLDLTRREADIAVRLVRPTRGDLVYAQIGSTQLAAFCHRSLAAGLEGAVRPADLAWVGWDVHDGEGPDSRWLVANVPDDRFVFRCANLDVLLRAVAGGAGAGLLPRELAAGYPELAEIAVEPALPPPMPVWLVCHRALRRVPRIAATWAFLEARFAEPLGR